MVLIIHMKCPLKSVCISNIRTKEKLLQTVYLKQLMWMMFSERKTIKAKSIKKYF